MTKGFYYSDEITRAFINSIMNPAVQDNNIVATFKDGTEDVYTMDIFELLKTDPDVETIIDAWTGELLYTT